MGYYYTFILWLYFLFTQDICVRVCICAYECVCVNFIHYVARTISGILVTLMSKADQHFYPHRVN